MAMMNKLAARKSLLVFLAVMMVGGGAGLWRPISASAAGVAAAPRPFIPHRVPQQVITQAHEDARRYQAVPPGQSSGPGRVLNVLPDGATVLTIGGATYYMAGGVYYRPVYQGDKVVYQAVENPYQP
jgi:hypothetical protein